MVPDKIYIAETPNKLIEIWSDEPIEPKPYITEHEYIRKDALQEWAKEMKEQVGLGLNAYDMGEENGKADMLNALIDKLNSL